MIRELVADELVWFLRQALSFAGHADPGGLARKLHPMLKQPGHDDSLSFAFLQDGAALAGATVRLAHNNDGVQTLRLSNVWHDRAPQALDQLIAHLLARHQHEVAVVHLYSLPESACAELTTVLGPQGFARELHHVLRFELSEVPPLGTPLVLEAYRQADEPAFRAVYHEAEGLPARGPQWAYLKRKGGRFTPDHWYIGRETLDQDPVGYAFCSRTKFGIDASFSLDGVGVLPRYRQDSEMLRRLLLSLLHELSGTSPFGAVNADLPDSDPKLIEILASLGFETSERVPLLMKRP